MAGCMRTPAGVAPRLFSALRPVAVVRPAPSAASATVASRSCCTAHAPAGPGSARCASPTSLTRGAQPQRARSPGAPPCARWVHAPSCGHSQQAELCACCQSAHSPHGLQQEEVAGWACAGCRLASWQGEARCQRRSHCLRSCLTRCRCCCCRCWSRRCCPSRCRRRTRRPLLQPWPGQLQA